MSRLFNSQGAIIAVVLFAAYTVYNNIVAPLMHQEEYSAERPDTLGFEDDEQVADTGSKAIKSVDTSVLFWNDEPRRDPYVHQARIDRQAIRHTKSLRGSGKRNSVVDDTPTMVGFVAGVDSRLAVVNNTIVSIGQKVGEYTVLDIDPQGVHLIDRTNRHRLKLKLEQ